MSVPSQSCHFRCQEVSWISRANRKGIKKIFFPSRKKVNLTKSRRQLWKSLYEFQTHLDLSKPTYFWIFTPATETFLHIIWQLLYLPRFWQHANQSGYTQSLPFILGKHLLMVTDAFSSPHASISSRARILTASCPCTTLEKKDNEVLMTDSNQNCANTPEISFTKDCDSLTWSG